jgi:D-sedoheptulose 7-phosphate isomerase
VSSRYLAELAEVLTQVQCATGEGMLSLTEGLEQAVALITGQTGQGRKVMFVGNGGSAAIASHQATDYLKNGGMRAVAFNDPATLTCLSNDLGYERVFEKQVEMLADPGDVLIAISSSGKSENILRAVAAGAAAGTRIVTMSGFAADNPLRQRGELTFYVPSHSYGFVEITHLALCHCIVDTIIARSR